MSIQVKGKPFTLKVLLSKKYYEKVVKKNHEPKISISSNIMDLTVKGSNSETGHRIHAIVLASVSSKFQDQLSPGKTITFPFPDEVLKAIIGIAYHGKVKEDFLDKWLEEAINVSLQYQIIELQEACRIHLYQKVTVENILDFLSLSKCLGCEKIVLKFVLSNVKALALESIKNMSYSDFILTCGEKLPRNFLSNGLESTPSQDPIISS